MTGSLGHQILSTCSPPVQRQWFVERHLHLGQVRGKPYSTHTAVSSCPAHDMRHTVPVLPRQASLLAQLPCYHSTQRSSALEHGNNQTPSQQVLLAVTARLSGNAKLVPGNCSIARLVIASAGCPKGSQQSKSQQS